MAGHKSFQPQHACVYVHVCVCVCVSVCVQEAKTSCFLWTKISSIVHTEQPPKAETHQKNL